MLYTYQRAAGLGQVQAQVNMGWCCLIGFGMETNHSEAFKHKQHHGQRQEQGGVCQFSDLQ